MLISPQNSLNQSPVRAGSKLGLFPVAQAQCVTIPMSYF